VAVEDLSKAKQAVDLSSREARAQTWLGRSWRAGDDALITAELALHLGSKWAAESA